LIKTALVLRGDQGSDLFHFLEECPELELVALACPDGEISWLTDLERKQFFITADLDKVTAMKELDAVIDGTGEPGIGEYLKKKIKQNVKYEQLIPGSVLHAIFSSREKLLETRLLKGELLAILNSVQDAVEVVDAKGVIKYVNPAFSRVTGIPEQKRINRSIFEVSPHGALAQALIQQKPVTGYRTYVGGSAADVISNASPINVDGEIMGAVVVFQPVGDILKLMDELKHSNTIIDNLYAQIDQISGFRCSFEMLIGQSRIFCAAVEKARKAARSESSLLISGESGTGKSLFARAVHSGSSRNKRPLIVFDCSSIPDSLQEIELFGCEKGAMPGILRTRLGKLELAEGSTLFVKEINSLNPFLQKKLLQVLEQHSFVRIGGEQEIPVDVRIIASAGENLLDASYKGYFFEELYRKLSLVAIDLPPLRKRQDDIPLLAENIMAGLNRKLGRSVNEISARAMQELMTYEWPGNISELKSALERAMIEADGPIIEYHHLLPYIGRLGLRDLSAFEEIVPLEKMEEKMLKLALTRYGENLEGKKKAAQALNISLATLYNKLKKYSS
jgi:PAS domain S-box-containing protein